jgi:4-hydroxyphenylacetate 3-monooxygenase
MQLWVQPGGLTLGFSPAALAVVGFAGRDVATVASHIEELVAQGAPRPHQVPTVWTLPGTLLSEPYDVRLPMPGATSGEAEAVLLRHDQEWYLAVGSDHTDRIVEQTSLEAAKQACPKIVGTDCWPLNGVLGRWDSLILRSSILLSGRWRPYQFAPLETLKPVDWYLERFAAGRADFAVFCGTVPTIGGVVTGTERFRSELIDMQSGAVLTCDYAIEQQTGRS